MTSTVLMLDTQEGTTAEDLKAHVQHMLKSPVNVLGLFFFFFFKILSYLPRDPHETFICFGCI